MLSTVVLSAVAPCSPAFVNYKILVIGEAGSGKTSVIRRYTKNAFSVSYKATLGVDFAIKTLNWDPDTVLQLQLWDIAGQERFGSMTRAYYKEATGAIVVADITKPASIEAAERWKKDLDERVRQKDGSPIPAILLLNKIDLAQADNMCVEEERIEALCKRSGFVAWAATSAKTSEGVSSSITTLVEHMVEADRRVHSARTSISSSRSLPSPPSAPSAPDTDGQIIRISSSDVRALVPTSGFLCQCG